MQFTSIASLLIAATSVLAAPSFMKERDTVSIVVTVNGGAIQTITSGECTPLATIGIINSVESGADANCAIYSDPLCQDFVPLDSGLKNLSVFGINFGKLLVPNGSTLCVV